MSSKGNFKDGKEEGLWKEYYDNGQVFEEIPYKDGKKEGMWRRYYYRNGQLETEGKFKYGNYCI